MDFDIERPADGWAYFPDDPLTGRLLVVAITLAVWLIYSAVAPIRSRSSQDPPEDEDTTWPPAHPCPAPVRPPAVVLRGSWREGGPTAPRVLSPRLALGARPPPS